MGAVDLSSIADILVEDDLYRICGPTEGYRCKVTYSLGPLFSLSPLAQVQVNLTCSIVQSFCVQSPFAASHPLFFCEVMSRQSRRGSVLVKVAFANGTIESSSFRTLWEEWLSTPEPQQLVCALRSQVPSIVAIVAHVNENPDRNATKPCKPNKESSYVRLWQEGAACMAEQTPNDKNYVLSCDSFCEVNQLMESKIYFYILQVLQLQHEKTDKRSLFLSGRDVIAMFLSLRDFYDSVWCATTCPSVFSDCRLNDITCCELKRKNEIAASLDKGYCGSQDIIITAGRHGLHPSTSVALINRAQDRKVANLIYISCNRVSFVRDWHLLKESFRLSDVAVFDFFPGTPYEMIVVHFTPYSSESLQGSLLMLPVGPPGSGKSICGAYLQNALKEDDTSLDICRSELGRFTLAAALAEDVTIPRRHLHISPLSEFTLWERDLIFKQLRSEGVSLNKTKVRVHEALLNSFRLHGAKNYLYVDTTNGSSDARRMYMEEWSGRREFLSDEACVVCLQYFFQLKNRSELLQRVQCRGEHPSFPDSEPEQIRKVDVILDSIEGATSTPYSSVASIAIDNTEDKDATGFQVLFSFSVYRLLSSQLARQACKVSGVEVLE